MATKSSRPRGRPKKTDDEKQQQLMQVLVDTDTAAAIAKYHQREGFAGRSEALRRLLRQALKAEGLL